MPFSSATENGYSNNLYQLFSIATRVVYNITIKTGNMKNAQTDARVCIWFSQCYTEL